MKSTVSIACAALAFAIGSCFAQSAPKNGGSATAGAAEAPAAGGSNDQLQPPGKSAPGEAAPGAKPQPGKAAPAMKPAASDEMQKTGQPKQDTQSGVDAQQQDGQQKQKPAPEAKPKAETQGQTEPETKKAGQAENGKQNGSTRSAPKISNVQQTKIRETIKTVDVRPVRVDFAVHIGVAVPRTVVLEPLPPEIVTVVPDYEGFRFFVVPGEIVIVDPDSLEIVAVLPL